MTENRFTTNGYKIYDTYTENEYLLTESDDITDLMNNLDIKARERTKALSKLQKKYDKLEIKQKELLDIINEKLYEIEVLNIEQSRAMIRVAYIRLKEILEG